MSGYKTHRFSQEPDDYEGPWPKENAMTVDEFMDLVGGDMTESEWRTARAALEALIAPAAPQQAEPQQAEPVSEFQRSAPERIWLSVGEVEPGTVFDDVADGGDEWAPWILQRDHADDVPYVRADLAHPPADEVQAEPISAIARHGCHYLAFPDRICNKCGRIHGFSHPPADEVQRLRDSARDVCEWADAAQWALGNETGVPAAKLDALRKALEGK